MRVLVVDDDREFRQSVVNILKLSVAGAVIKVARNGKEAFEILKFSSEKFDIIISDFNMPEMNGLELFRAMKNDPLLREILFILMTGSYDLEVSRAIRSGGGRFILKSSSHDLLEEIEEVISN